MRAIRVAVLAAVLFLGANLQAATRVVPSALYPDIASALAAAVDGDTIKVGPGRYQENVVVAGPLNNVKILGARAIWDGNIAGTHGQQLDITGNNITVSGFEFQNGGDTGTPLPVLRITGFVAKVINCVFRGAEGTVIDIQGDDGIIQGCTITGTADVGDQINVNGHRVLIMRCAIRNSSGDLNIVGDDAKILNNALNTIDHDSEIYVDGINGLVSNNRISNTNDDGIYLDGTNGTVTNNRLVNLGECENAIYINGNGVVKGNLIDGVGVEDDFQGIYVDGIGMVTNNAISNVNAEDYDIQGIYVNGINSTVSNNTLFNLDGYEYLSGIEAYGDNVVVTNNKLTGLHNSGEDDDLYGIYVDGNNALIQGNRLSQLTQSYDSYYNYCIYLDGDNGLVQRNTIQFCSSGYDIYGFYLDGDGNRLVSNVVHHLYTVDGDCYGAYVDGDDVLVDRNQVHDLTYAYGLDLFGDRFTVTNNRFWNLGNESYGISIDQNNTGSGDGGRIENNSVRNCSGYAYDLDDIFFTAVTNCTATDCGGYDGDPAFYLAGDNNTFTRCKATNAADDGFYLEGSSNTFSQCTATRCDRDGFDVESGDSNTFDRCSATNCAAEGFDNSAGVTSTTITNGSFKANRIDIANADDLGFSLDAATTFTTGGAGTPPEID
ncbi:MAG: right-handed parallel beta-helix repeat-containing protein [Planctomycetota bacterium]|nr:right-handed parallel beta-helix repeat-containing protein [Planctomycetota bacterium]